MKDEKKIINPTTVDSIIGIIQSLAPFALTLKCTQTNIIEIKSSMDFLLVYQRLCKNRIFIVIDKENNQKYSKAIDLYYQYLCFVEEQNIGIDAVSLQEQQPVMLVNNEKQVFKNHILGTNITQPQNHLRELSNANFPKWFNPLIEALKQLGGKATPAQVKNKIVDNCKISIEELAETRGKSGVGKISNEIDFARQYLKSAGYVDGRQRGIWVLTDKGWNSIITDELASIIFRAVIDINRKMDKKDFKKVSKVISNDEDVHIALKTVDEYLDTAIFNEYQHTLLSQLETIFPNGIRTGSVLQIRKFRQRIILDDKSIMTSLEDSDLVNDIKKIAVCCIDDLYMSPNSIASKAIIREIITDVITLFNDQKSVIHLDALYEKYKENLLFTNIYNKDILGNVILHFMRGDIQLKYCTIIRANCGSKVLTKTTVADEIMSVLQASDVPLDKHEIVAMLPHLAANKVENIIRSDYRTIRTAQSIFWHIDKYNITKEEIDYFSEIISDEIKSGFVSIKKILPRLIAEVKSFFERNDAGYYMTIYDILKYYLSDRYGFKLVFIGKQGQEMSGIKAVEGFISDRQELMLWELKDFVLENELPGNYTFFIATVEKYFDRIDKNKFIRRR